MFGRTIETRIVKKSNVGPDDSATTELSKDDVLDVVTKTGMVLAETVACYMLCDTIRKIAISRLSK